LRNIGIGLLGLGAGLVAFAKRRAVK
jgi:hypothetical protein